VAADETADDALLTGLESNAVALLEQATNRYFGGPKGFTEVFDGGLTNFFLKESPVTTPAPTVDEWDGTAWVAVPAADWEVDRRVVVRTDRRPWPNGSRRYRVKYTAGYVEEPGDVRQAVMEIVAWKYRQRKREGLRSETLGSYSYTLALTGSIDLAKIPAAAEVIEHWRQGWP
jgi:hypothetical protein